MRIQELEEITCLSSIDGSPEPLLMYHPGGETPVPLVVGLHTWSYDRYNQVDGMLPLCKERGWGRSQEGPTYTIHTSCFSVYCVGLTL